MISPTPTPQKNNNDNPLVDPVDSIPLAQNKSITIQPYKEDLNKSRYTFYDDGIVLSSYDHGPPLELTKTTNIGKEIFKYLDPENQFKREKIEKDFTIIKQILHNHFSDAREQYKQEEENRLHEEAVRLKEQIKKGEDKLKSIKNPLHWIGSHIDWLTAGERRNILYSFLAYSSQIILREPISVIGLGEGGSGKTHIQETALSLIPDDFIINEKKVTEAAMFNRAKENPYYYDGKIVNYGDMGGLHDQDYANESKNMLKELQSEGYLCKPLSIPDKNHGWTVENIELHGRPCLTYTTIPGHDFDEQEESRSIFITPRTNNTQIFNERKNIIELRGTDYKIMTTYKSDSEIIKYIVLHLREIMETHEVINPYISQITDLFKESKFLKRDIDKYNSILKTIAVYNFYSKTVQEIFDTEEDKLVKRFFVSKQDLQLFISLLEPSLGAITSNLKPKAAEILHELQENIDEWETIIPANNPYEDVDEGTVYSGITVNDYYNKQKLNLSKRSLYNYFKELNQAGYLEVVRKSNGSRATYWNLSDSNKGSGCSVGLDLDNVAFSRVYDQLGSEISDGVQNDKHKEGLSIMFADPDIDIPSWNNHDFADYRVKYPYQKDME